MPDCTTNTSFPCDTEHGAEIKRAMFGQYLAVTCLCQCLATASTLLPAFFHEPLYQQSRLASSSFVWISTQHPRVLLSMTRSFPLSFPDNKPQTILNDFWPKKCMCLLQLLRFSFAPTARALGSKEPLLRCTTPITARRSDAQLRAHSFHHSSLSLPARTEFDVGDVGTQDYDFSRPQKLFVSLPVPLSGRLDAGSGAPCAIQ
jgi:hypothetical protein